MTEVVTIMADSVTVKDIGTVKRRIRQGVAFTPDYLTLYVMVVGDFGIEYTQIEHVPATLWERENDSFRNAIWRDLYVRLNEYRLAHVLSWDHDADSNSYYAYGEGPRVFEIEQNTDGAYVLNVPDDEVGRKYAPEDLVYDAYIEAQSAAGRIELERRKARNEAAR
jgi:hypothetical protein